MSLPTFVSPDEVLVALRAGALTGEAKAQLPAAWSRSPGGVMQASGALLRGGFDA